MRQGGHTSVVREISFSVEKENELRIGSGGGLAKERFGVVGGGEGGNFLSDFG